MLADTILTGVCHIVDAVLEGTVPAGAFGTIHSAANTLRDERISEHTIRATEDLSVAMLRLEWGLRKQDPDAVERAREQLRAIKMTLADSLDESRSQPSH